jgi:hypothetical protein
MTATSYRRLGPMSVRGAAAPRSRRTLKPRGRHKSASIFHLESHPRLDLPWLDSRTRDGVQPGPPGRSAHASIIIQQAEPVPATDLMMETTHARFCPSCGAGARKADAIYGARTIHWRSAVSCGCSLDEAAPDHSTISRTRRLIDLETHRAVFTWVQVRLVEPGLLKGKTDAIDATTLRGECGAAQYRETRRRGELSGVLDRARAGLGHRYADARGAGSSGPKRKKKTSNTDWRHPGDPEAKVAKIKDGRTHLARPSRS